MQDSPYFSVSWSVVLTYKVLEQTVGVSLGVRVSRVVTRVASLLMIDTHPFTIFYQKRGITNSKETMVPCQYGRETLQFLFD